MKHWGRILLLSLAVLVPGLVPAWGDPPPQPLRGRVLILANERTLEGDIERVGDQYRIRREGMGEMLMPAGPSTRLCADWKDAFGHLASAANLFDADERLRLARWCQANGLSEQALIQVNAALEMRPNHAPSRQLQASLKRVLELGPSAMPNRPPSVQIAAVPPAVDLSAEALALFTTKVQPILLNACASCHTGERGGNFQLTRIYEGSQRIATQRNLAVALSHVHREQAALSPLLIKALSAHGSAAKPPLPSRQSPPFQVLQEWVDLTLRNNPHLRENLAAIPTGLPAPPGVPRTLPAIPDSVIEQTSFRSIPSAPMESTRASKETSLPPTAHIPGAPPRANAPEPPPVSPPRSEPADPYDPAVFNRQNNPPQ